MNLKFKLKGKYEDSQILDLSELTASDTLKFLSESKEYYSKALILPYNEPIQLSTNILKKFPYLEEIIWPKIKKMEKKLFQHSLIKYMTIGSCKTISEYAFEFSNLMFMSIDSCPIIEIGAFKNSKIKKIILPQDLKTIQQEAFEMCRYLREVDLSKVKNPINILRLCFEATPLLTKFDFSKVAFIDNLAFSSSGIKEAIFCSKTEIGNYAFSESKLQLIEFNKNVTFKSGYQFTDCDDLKTVNCNGINIIPAGCFFGCKNLESINGTDNVTSIGIEAFSYTSISKIDVPKVICIGEYAFSNTKIETITLYADYIDENVFKNCKSLKKVTINSKIKAISGTIFSLCTNLESVDLYNTDISHIYPETFSDSAISNIILPKNLKSIGYKAFSKSKLKSITIPDSVASIESYAFAFSNLLQEVVWSKGCDRVSAATFKGCFKLKSFLTSQSVRFIDSEAFANTCIKTAFNSAEKIMPDAFKECTGQIDLRQTSILLPSPFICNDDVVLLPYYY